MSDDETYGFDESGARRIVDATRIVEATVRNPPTGATRPPQQIVGCFARITLRTLVEDSSTPSGWRAAYDWEMVVLGGNGWVRDVNEVEGHWNEEADFDGAAYEINGDTTDLACKIVWIRPGFKAGAGPMQMIFMAPAVSCFRARLTGRSGEWYDWQEQLFDGSDWADDKEGRNSEDNEQARQWNLRMHNGQGGHTAPVVLMYEIVYCYASDGGNDFATYWFEYTVGTPEDDDERGDIGFGPWDRNGDDNGFKGFFIHEVVVAAP